MIKLKKLLQDTEVSVKTRHRLFEVKNESDVIGVLDSLGIENYTIHGDLSVSVDGDVFLNKIDEIPIQFKEVRGDFYIRDSNLMNLEGAPRYVSGTFHCQRNNLKSLMGSPKIVGEKFTVLGNKLKSLKGAPEVVGRVFECSNNQLTNLEGGPQKVGGTYACSDNKLTSLKGAPKRVGNNFDCEYNKLTSLEGAPRYVNGNFECYANPGKFTEEDVQMVSKVKGDIIVQTYRL